MWKKEQRGKMHEKNKGRKEKEKEYFLKSNKDNKD